MPWHTPGAHQRAIRAVWKDYVRQLAQVQRLPWHNPRARQLAYTAAWGQLAAHQASHSALWRALAARGAYVRLPWGQGNTHQQGYTIPYTVDPDPPEGGTITIPERDVYIMIPTLSIVRLSDGADLQAISCSLRFDEKSFAWSFDAAIPASSKALCNPDTTDPVDVQISINGYTWTCIVTGYSDSRKFGGTGISISGKSRSAQLGKGYAPARSYTETSDRNASQLADQEMPSGWTLIWDAVDWLVPAGTWSYHDLTPIEAIAQIAESIGAMTVPHNDDLSITVQPSYPTSPWDYPTATPYAVMPASVVASYDGQWEGRTDYNGIYVSGESGGSIALIKRTGTDGANQLPLVVDKLMVDADPIRERGRVELAKSGVRKTETVRLLLFPAPASETNPGVIMPGRLLEIMEPDGSAWRGRSSDIRIDAGRGGDAMSVRQVIAIERHD